MPRDSVTKPDAPAPAENRGGDAAGVERPGAAEPRPPSDTATASHAIAPGTALSFRCPRCGTPQRMGRFGVSCVCCLLATGLEPLDEEEVSLPGGEETAALPLPAPRAPRTLDHYELVLHPDGSPWELGHGAMGVTFKAFDTNLRVPVALKLIHRNLLHEPSVRERFIREARAAAALRHPNVATIYHLGTRGDDYFFAMEFIEGETLDALVRRRGALPAAEALDIALQVARALAAASRQGLVHRDIKPANLMLIPGEENAGAAGGPSWTVKVIDFGVAKSAAVAAAGGADLTGGLLIGTPSFASPEQLRGEPADFRSDLYSLGVTLWFSLLGRVPFVGDSLQVIGQHLSRTPAFAELSTAGAPSPVVALLRRMLEKEPRRRPQTPAELIAALERCLRALSRTRAGAAGRRRRGLLRPFAFWRERVRRPRWIAAGLAILGVALGTGLLVRGRYGSGPAAAQAPGIPALPPRAPVAPPEKTLAVLPFENDGGEDAQFVESVTEDLTAHLSKLDGLRVIARSSANALAKSQLPPAQLAARLGASHLLYGRVRRHGDRFRVWTELVDAPSDRVLWSETYDNERVEDLLRVQRRLGQEIANGLRLQLSPAKRAALERAPTANPLAYDCYLRGRAFYRRYTSPDMERAVGLFKKALELDPNFALAHAALAEALCLQVDRWDADKRQLDAAAAAAREAIRLDPASAEAHRALALHFWVKNQLHDCLQASLRAIELNPNYVPALSLCSNAWRNLGRMDQALPYLRRAIELDPASSRLHTILGDTLTLLADDRGAGAAFQKALELQPDLTEANLGLSYLSLLQGDEAGAHKFLALAQTGSPDNAQGRILAADTELFTNHAERAETLYRQLIAADADGGLYHPNAIRGLCALGGLRARAGDRAEAERLLAEAARLDEEDSQKFPDRFEPIYDLAAVRALQGRGDEALACLQRADAAGWSHYRATRRDPRFASLARDSRFLELLRRWEENTARMRRDSETGGGR